MPRQVNESGERASASQVFEAWLERQTKGELEPFEHVLARHPVLRESLEKLKRADALGAEALPSIEAPPASPSAQRTLGDFRILRKLGEGAMGVVWEAEQVSLRRRVALKVLAPHLTLNERALRRFQHEAEITARLQHPGIIAIHQVGEAEGTHFISMELVAGTSLDRAIERMRRESPHMARAKPSGGVVEVRGLEPEGTAAALRPREPGADTKRGSSAASNKSYIESAVRLVCQVADALEHAHQAGVLHRDVKPSNVLVRADGSAVLTDFGLAREDGLPAVSQSGDFIGTPHYVSPEQAMSGRVPVDARSDVFSLGATLYELLTLELAFPGESIHSVLAAIVSKPPRDPAKLNPALAPDLVTVLLKALEKDPDQRYASAAELAEDLRAFIDYRPIRARRTPTVLRAWRWVKREPLKAALSATLALGLPLLATVAYVAIRSQLTVTRVLREHRLPELLEKGFLALGAGDLSQAEARFLEILALDSASVEANAGRAMALLAGGRNPEAQEALVQAEVAVGPSSALARIRARVLRVNHQLDQALEIERGLPQAQGHLERFVQAMLLLHERPFLSGAPSPALLVVPGGVGTTASSDSGASILYRTDSTSDTFAQARERARDAIELLTRAIENESGRAIYHFARAWAVWIARDREAASRAVDSILAQWPELPVAHFYAGLAAEILDPQTALAHYDAALERDEGLESALARRANLNLGLGATELAARQLSEIVDRFPGSVSHRVNLSVALTELGRFDPAIAAARSALERDPGFVPAHDAVGTAYYRMGRLEQAEEAFRKAVELEPSGARLRNDHGIVLLGLGRFEAAEAELLRGLELDPGDPYALYNLGSLELARSEPRRAGDFFEQAIEAFDRDRKAEFPLHLAWGALGIAQRRSGKDWVESFRRAVAIEPEHAALNAELGLGLHYGRRFGEAVGPLGKALILDRDGSLHRALVECFLVLGQRAEALPVTRSWTERFSDSAEAWNYRASLQVDPCTDRLGDPTDGLASAKRALELSSPPDYHVLDTYACALLLNHKPKEALEVAYEALGMAEGHSADAGILQEMERHLERIEAASESAAR